MTNPLPLILLCFLSTTCFSQELKLWKGKDEKTFKTGSLFEIVIDKIFIENIDDIEHSTIEYSFDLD